MPIQVAIVDDDRLYADSLRECVSASPDIVCNAVYHSAEDALEHLTTKRPEILLVDVNLPRMNGIDLVAQVDRLYPDVICLIITAHEESTLIFDALKAGACGYLLKPTPLLQILEAVRKAHAGGSPMSSQIARHVVQFFQTTPARSNAQSAPDPLAEREREVLQLLSKGFAYKEIGENLEISTHTVNAYIRRIYKKLQARSRSEAIAKYRDFLR